MKAFSAGITVFLSLTGALAAGTWTKRNVAVPRATAMPPSCEWLPTSLKLVYDSWRRVTAGIGGHSNPALFYLAVSEYDGINWQRCVPGMAP